MIKKANKFSDWQPAGELKRISDFLPAPNQLIPAQEHMKVTLALTKSSVDFFKREARKHRTKYQVMIRELINLYAQKHQPG